MEKKRRLFLREPCQLWSRINKRYFISGCELRYFISGFDDISRDGYGLYVVDKAGNVLFEKDTFDKNKAATKKTEETKVPKMGQ